MLYQRYKNSNYVKEIYYNQTLYVKNLKGYLVLGSAIVYRFNSISGNKWVLTLEPRYSKEAIILIHKSGKILGVNENAIKYGFRAEIYGEYLNPSILKKLYNERTTELGINQDTKMFNS